MAKLGIYTGVSANDGLGDTLLTGAIKINSNFDELYDLLGTGGFLGDAHLDRLDVSGLSTFVGVSTFLSDVYIAQNLFVNGIDINSGSSIGVDILTRNINASGIVTVGGIVDLNSDLDVDGRTELDTTNISETLNVVGVSTFGSKVNLSDDLYVAGNVRIVGVTTFQEDIYLGNNDKINLGGSQDLQIYNDGNNSYIVDSGVGDLYVRGTAAINFENAVGIETYAKFNVDGATELWYDNVKKFETTGYGVTVFGTTKTENLDVTGVSTFAGNINADGDLDVDGFTELDSTNISETLNVVGLTTLGSNVDINADLDVDGRTELDTTNISETLNVVGVSTFGSDVDINAGLDVDGRTELDITNISETLNVVGVSTFGSDVDINANVDISGYLDVDGHTELDNVNISGVSTFAGDIDANGDLDVDGRTELDTTNISETLNVVGVSTFNSTVNVNDGVVVTGIVTASAFHTGPEGISIRVESDSITGPSSITIDPAGVGDNSGLVIIKGDLQVDGTQTVINSTTVEVDDLNITLASGAINDAAADGGGITIESGDGDKTFQFEATGDNFGSSENINLASGKTYKINNTEVLSSTQLTVANINSSGIVTATILDTDTANIQSVTSTNINVSGVATFSDTTYINGDVIVDANTFLDNVDISENLKVTGVSTFLSNVDIDADLDVDGRTELDTTNISETLNVVGITTLNDFVNVLSNMSVSGVATITTIYGDFDGELNNPGSTYYVSVNGSDSHTGDNINQQFATLAHALSVATSGDTILVGSGTFNEVFPLTVPQGVCVRGVGLRATFIQPTTETRQNDGFLMNGETTVEDLTVGNMYEPGYAFKFADNCNTTTRSPYIQRVTVLNKGSVITSDDPYGFDTAHSPPVSYKAGRGVLIDGSVVAPTSLEPAMLFNECTFICPNNTALEMTNGARTEWVNCFTYFADKGIYAHDGNVGLASTGYVRIKTSGFSGTTPQANDELYYLQSNEVSATYNQVGTSITFTKVGHGLTVGDRVFADFTSGAAPDGFYYIDTYIDADNFSVTSSSNTTSGNVSYKEALGFGTVRVYTPSTGLSSITSKGEGLFELPSTRLGKTVTAFGNAQLSTSEQKFGTSSLVLDGVGDYATVASNVDFGFGTSDFTLETFVRLDVTGTTQTIFDLRSGSSSDSAITVGVANTNVVSVSYGSTNIITGTTALTSGQWYHIAVSRSSSSTKLFVDGTQEGSTYADTNDYGVSKPLVIGSDYSGSNGFDGYIDETRISNNSRYTGSFTPTTSAFNSDGNDKLLMHFDGITGSASFTDSSIPNQDIRWVRSGVGIATATKIILADYQQFGAAMRSIGSAVVFGNTGISADGPGVTLRMFAFNFGHIGAGKDFSQDISLVNQESEVVETNNANVYFTSIDQSGDFRVGDAFYVNQKSGTVNFGGQDFTLNSLSDLNITDGTNTNTITPTTATFGNIQIAGNEITSTSGDININPSGNSETNIDGNLNVSGILTASVLQTGALQLGDTSIVIEDSGSNGIIKLSTDSVEAVRIDDSQRVGIGSTIPTSKLDVVGDIKISGVSTFNSSVDINADLDVDGRTELDITNISETLNVVGISTFGSDVDINASIDVDGHTELDDLNVSGVATFAQNVEITGNLTVNGTQTILNTSQLEVEDINIGIASVNPKLSNAALDGAGITIHGASGDKTLTWSNANSRMEFNTDLYAPNIESTDITLNGNLNVTGVSTFVSSVDIQNNLNVSGVSTFSSDLDINASIDVDGHTELDDLNVSGVSTFSSNVDINASIDISTNLVVDGFSDLDELNVAGISTFNTDVEFVGPGITSAYWDSSLREFKLKDNVKITFGDGDDLQIYHNGDNSYITDSGTGDLILGGVNVKITDPSSNNMAVFNDGGSVELYHNTNKKFETTSSGGTLTGNLAFSTIGINGFTITGFGTNYSTNSNPNSWAVQPMASEIWHDLFAFQSHYTTTYETYNGSTWSSATVDSRLFAQKEDQSVTVATGSPTTAVRWTFQGTAWGLADWLVIGHAFNSGTSNKTILVESGTDGSTWTTRHESTYTNVATSMFHYLGAYNGDSYLRVTITRNGSSTGDVNLSNIKLLTDRPGDQGQGKEYQYPYSWDGEKNITTRNNLTVPYNFNVTGISTFGDVNVGGAITVTGNVDFNASLNVDGHTELDDLNVSGVSTFASTVDINSDLDVDGFTELDSTNISETLNVVGVSTFGSDIDINASIDVDGHTELDNVNISGVSTFVGAADFNGDLDVDGRTELDITNISETLNVVGISTFESDIDINASIDVDGHTELDDLNVSGVSTFVSSVDINAGLDVYGRTELDITNISETLNVVGVSTFGSDVDINANVDISGYLDVDGHTELDNLNVSGVSTFVGAADFNGDLDVDGRTELDITNISETLNVVGVSTFGSDIDINASIDVDGHTELDDLNVSGVATATAFHTGAEGSAIRVTSDTISGPATINIDPAGVGDNTGTVVIKGDLQIDGTTTTVNSTTVTVDDKNIVLGSGAANDAAADGGGITLESGDGDKTFNWVDSTDSWTSSENFDLANTKTYKIAGTDVLTSTSLGTNVTTSFLTTVGTLSVLNVGGNVNVTGVSTFVGVTTFQANATFQSDVLVEGSINSSTDVTIDGVSVLTSASDEAVALAIALG